MFDKPGDKLMRLITLATILAVIAGPAFAHHPMGGETPETLLHGLMSGVGHPIIGVDHFAFIIAAGVLAALIKSRLWVLAPLGLVAGALLGSAIHLLAINIPSAEILIATSVVVAGASMAIGAQVGLGVLIVAFAFAGIFHGYAYAESVIGAEKSIIAAYLISFSGTQWVLALLAGFAARLTIGQVSWVRTRAITGSAIAGLGAVLLAQAIV